MATLDTRNSIPTPRDFMHSAPLDHNAARAAGSYSFPPSRSTPELVSAAGSLIERSSSPGVSSPSALAQPNLLSPTGRVASGPPTAIQEPNGSLRHSVSSVSSDGLATVSVDKAGRRRMQGRANKLKADLYMLAGRWREALLLCVSVFVHLLSGILRGCRSSYHEAITTAKAVLDPVWEASASERVVMTTVLLAWLPVAFEVSLCLGSCAHKDCNDTFEQSPNAPHQPSKVDLTTLAARPASQDAAASALANARDLPDKYSAVIAAYARLIPPFTATASSDALPPVLFIEACLRFARMQLAVLATGGWSSAALDAMVSTAPGKPPTDIVASAYIKAHIAELLGLAYTPLLAQSPVPDRLLFLNTIVAGYSSLGFARKRAAILLEIAAIATDVSRRARAEVREGQSPGAIVSTAPEVDGNDAVLLLLDQCCEAYGVEIVKRFRAAEAGRRVSVIGGTQQRSTGADAAGDGAEDDRFGWPDLQVAVVRDAVKASEMLPGELSLHRSASSFVNLLERTDYSGALRFTISALRETAAFMPPLDQFHLSQSIPAIFSHAARRGAAFALDYWGPTSLLMSIEAVPCACRC